MTRYGHNSRNLVRVGQSVQKSEAIAVIGSTGRSTGTHVHFEVLRDGKVLNPNGISQRPEFATAPTRRADSAAPTLNRARRCAPSRRARLPVKSPPLRSGARRLGAPVANWLTRIFGSRNQRLVSQYNGIVKTHQRVRARAAGACATRSLPPRPCSSASSSPRARRSTTCCPRRSPSSARPRAARWGCVTSTCS